MVSRQGSGGAVFLHPFAASRFCRQSSSEATREQRPDLVETVVIPPVSREEVNFKHVSRQECRRGSDRSPESFT